LNCIITGEETWVHHHESETEWQSMQQKHKSSSKKSKLHPSARKLLLTVFWYFQSPIIEHYMDRGITVISVNYCDILGNELSPAIGTKGEEVCHSMFWYMMVDFTFSNIQQLIWEVFQHRARSPGLAPSDFHLFDLSGP
jgi:hypothetical protein